MKFISPDVEKVEFETTVNGVTKEYCIKTVPVAAYRAYDVYAEAFDKATKLSKDLENAKTDEGRLKVLKELSSVKNKVVELPYEIIGVILNANGYTYNKKIWENYIDLAWVSALNLQILNKDVVKKKAQVMPIK